MLKRKKRRKFVYTLAKPYSFWLVMDSLVILANTAIAMYLPWLIGEWFEGTLPVFSTPNIASYLSIMAILWIAKMFTGFKVRRKKYKMLTKVRKDLYGRMLYYPMSFYSDMTSDQLTETIVSDTIEIRDYIFDDLPSIFINFVTVLSCISMLFSIDPQVAAVMLIGIPVSIILTLPLKKKLYKISKRQKDTSLEMRSYLNDTLANVAQVKISNQEKQEVIKGNNLFKKESRALRSERWLEAIMSPVMTLISIGLFLVVGGFAVQRIIDGYITLGGIISFLLYFTVIVAEVVGIIISVTKRNRIVSVLDRVHDVFELDAEIVEDGEDLLSIDKIEFKDVAFGYNEKLQFNSISFSAKKGELIALVGGSGSGKTTIFSLIERLYMPSSGVININDRNADEYSISSIRENIAYVNQNCNLMEDTIRNNLTYGLEETVTDEKIFDCMKVTGCDEFVKSLPNGLNYQIIQGGKSMSGGQKQKLALTRALLKDYSMLLLDEATASLDSASEALIEAYVKEARVDKLVIMIAHRLSTIVNATKIIVVKDGEILAQGTHKKLLKDCLYYKALVDEQYIDNSEVNDEKN